MYTLAPPINQQFDPFYHVIAGDTFSLNCTVSNVRGRGIIFLWYKNNENIAQLTKIIARESTLQGMQSISQLYIKKLDADQHSGRYICLENNKPISTTTVIVES